MYPDVIKGGYLLSSDKSRLDRDFIHAFLSRESYWARHIPRAIVDGALDHSLCFGVYAEDAGGAQVAFARVITDYHTSGYICDVFVDEAHRGKGLGTWMIGHIVSHPGFADFRAWTLLTRDAQGLYERFGFRNPEDPRLFLWKKNPDAYLKYAGGAD